METVDETLLPLQIISSLQKFDANANELGEIFRQLQFTLIKKGEKFCKAGRVCDRLGILTKGLLYAEFENHKEENTVSRFFFTPDNMIVTNFESFKSKEPSNETITALEDSHLFFLTAENLEYLYEKVPVVNKIGRHFAEDSYRQALQRNHELKVLSNKEQVEHLYNKHRFLFQKVPIKLLSSYLGVHRNAITEALKDINNRK